MKEELKEVGLNEKEVNVYLELLKIGTTKIQEISNKTKIHRTYTYDILKSLKQKGLVSYVIKSGVKYYESTNPDKLLEILNEKKEKIKKIIPKLKEIQQPATTKPMIQIYEGKEGIKTVLDDIIKTKKEILVYGPTKDQISTLEFYFPNFITRRIKQRIKTKIITERSTEALKINKNNKKELRKTKYFQSSLKLKTVTNIYGEKVAILDFGENLIGIIIQDKNYADSQRQIFDLLWKQAKS